MKFSIERKSLIRMVETVSRKMPNQKRREKNLRLSACQARAFVECNETVAGIEALVFEDGQCTLRRGLFLTILKTFRGKKILILEARPNRLSIGNFTMDITSYSHRVEPPGDFQVFPVTDLDVVPSSEPNPSTIKPARGSVAGKPPARSSANQCPPEADSHQEYVDSDPEWTPEDDELMLEGLGIYARGFTNLPQATPAQRLGLARASYAINCLPFWTPGVSVEFSVGVRVVDDDSYTENWIMFRITENEFSFGTMLRMSGDHHTEIAYFIDSGGCRNAGLKAVDCLEQLREMLEQNDRKDLLLSVQDRSEPNCQRRHA